MAMIRGKGCFDIRPRARIISLLGEELISDEPVALTELVKNSYDADATRVEVVFEKEGEAQKNITVLDNGHGMDLVTVRSAWIEPATTRKKTTPVSPGGRTMQGAKGIGRLASAKLASKLILESRVEGADLGIRVEMDWKEFIEDRFLDEIKIPYSLGDYGPKPHGTKLTLGGLLRTWTEKDYEILKNRFSRLVSPFPESTDDFSISLEVPGFSDISGEISPPSLIMNPMYSLVGEIDEKGLFHGRVEVRNSYTEQSKQYEAHQLLSKDRTPICGPLGIRIYAWDRDREFLEPFANKYRLLYGQAKALLNEFSGVSIYRDDFRVYPYGERGNDWLGLDSRTRQEPTRRLANNQTVASITISRLKNPSLEDRSTREGLKVNEAYLDVGDWFEAVLKILENHRYSSRPRREKSIPHDKFEYARQHLTELKKLTELRLKMSPKDDFALEIKKTGQALEENISDLRELFSQLLMTSGLGQMIDIVIHEIGAPAGKLDREIERLEYKIAEKPYAPTIFGSTTKMKSWVAEILLHRERLRPQAAGKRGRATSFSVQEEIQNTLDLFSHLLTTQRIEVKTVFPSLPVYVKMSQAVLDQILVNLIHNSLYWLGWKHGYRMGGKLEIELLRQEHGFLVRISDDGPGIQEENTTKIFEPYFSTKSDGMGLGLHIASLLVEPYGSITLSENPHLDGACFEVAFNKGVGL